LGAGGDQDVLAVAKGGRRRRRIVEASAAGCYESGGEEAE